MFPRAKKALGLEKLQQLGEAVEAARTTAPSRPHPHAPDEAPANLGATMTGVDAGHAAIEATGHVVREARQEVARDR